MKTKRLAILICLAVFVIPALSVASPQSIQKSGKVLVTQVSVTVTPEAYAGSCPKKFTYTGRISARGTGQVSYRWITSDNPLGVVKKTYFKRSASKIITLMKEYNSNGAYWASIEIISPNRMTSNRATCRLTCIPVMVRPSFKISGNINGGAEGRLLRQRKVKVFLKRDGRTLLSRELTLDSNGQCIYEFGGPILLAGNYTVNVEKVTSDPATVPDLNVCFNGTNPPLRSITLTNTSPTAANQNFTINFVIAWDRPLCW